MYKYNMNYRNMYNRIINNAINEKDLRINGYYEKHHILPKSLGGNKENNLVKLTAKEHFICHWLLVKMYNKGTIERNKMLFAFWRMKSNPNNNGKRYINSRAYEKLRIEYSEILSKKMKILQIGENNSNFGKHWYTNSDTGECRSYIIPPNEKWIIGRNLFHGESSSIKSHKISIIRNKNENLKLAKELWNEYHNGNYTSIRDYCRKTNKALGYVMTKMLSIPAYNKVFIGRSHNNGSKKEYINVFEV